MSVYKKETDAEVEAVVGVDLHGWMDEAVTVFQLGRW